MYKQQAFWRRIEKMKKQLRVRLGSGRSNIETGRAPIWSYRARWSISGRSNALQSIRSPTLVSAWLLAAQSRKRTLRDLKHHANHLSFTPPFTFGKFFLLEAPHRRTLACRRVVQSSLPHVLAALHRNLCTLCPPCDASRSLDECWLHNGIRQCRPLGVVGPLQTVPLCDEGDRHVAI
jgi:hypothetical protein